MNLHPCDHDECPKTGCDKDVTVSLLAELKQLRDSAEQIKEKCRGPGKHFVFLAMCDACFDLNMAGKCEVERLSNL